MTVSMEMASRFVDHIVFNLIENNHDSSLYITKQAPANDILINICADFSKEKYDYFIPVLLNNAEDIAAKFRMKLNRSVNIYFSFQNNVVITPFKIKI